MKVGKKDLILVAKWVYRLVDELDVRKVVLMAGSRE